MRYWVYSITLSLSKPPHLLPNLSSLLSSELQLLPVWQETGSKGLVVVLGCGEGVSPLVHSGVRSLCVDRCVALLGCA